MKVMVWFYNHRDALGPLMDSEEESDDDDASENGLDDEEEDPLNQVGENELSRISLSLQCVVNVFVVVIDQLTQL